MAHTFILKAKYEGIMFLWTAAYHYQTTECNIPEDFNIFPLCALQFNYYNLNQQMHTDVLDVQ